MEIPKNVLPGDLITAKLWNDLVVYANSLEERILKLEADAFEGEPPVILSVKPEGSIPVGTQITVGGKNFARRTDRNIVSVGGFIIDALDLSSDTEHLIFGIPFLTFTGDKLSTTLTVRTQYGISSWPLTLIPALKIPKGNLVFREDNANKDVIPTPNTTAIWKFEVEIQPDILDATYQYMLGFEIYNVKGSISKETWTKNTRLNLESGNADLTKPVELKAFTPVKFEIETDIPAGAQANSDGFSFNITAQAQFDDTHIAQTPLVGNVLVGTAKPSSDSKVDFNIIEPVAPNKARHIGDFVEIPFESYGQVTYRANFNPGSDGDFVVFASLDPEKPEISNLPGLWNIFNYGPKTITGKKAGENEPITVTLQCLAKSNATHTEQATLTIWVKRTTGEVFNSWTTINIRGYTVA